MHKLNRSEIPAPRCLRKYQHGRDNWDTLSQEDKLQIQVALEQMQGRRCAYCECGLDQQGKHIEHFRQRSRYSQGTFDWNNLFWSCCRQESCGIHKDRCDSYQHEYLIKPDVEDPEHFFLFVSDGSIVLRPDLTPTQKHRAQETLRIFNLDAQWGPLRRMRETAVAGYLKDLEDLQELSNHFTDQEIQNYIENQFAFIKYLPFCTAIKHVLTPARS